MRKNENAKVTFNFNSYLYYMKINMINLENVQNVKWIRVDEFKIIIIHQMYPEKKEWQKRTLFV